MRRSTFAPVAQTKKNMEPENDDFQFRNLLGKLPTLENSPFRLRYSIGPVHKTMNRLIDSVQNDNICRMDPILSNTYNLCIYIYIAIDNIYTY